MDYSITAEEEEKLFAVSTMGQDSPTIEEFDVDVKPGHPVGLRLERGLCLPVGQEKTINREGGLQAGHHKGGGNVQDVDQGHHTARDVG